MLTISELAARTGAAPSALRFYERRGLLRPTGRTGGKRTYDDRAVEQVALVDLLQQCGMTIAEIASVVDADGHVDEGWRDVARSRLAALDAQLAFIERARTLLSHTLLCRSPSLDSCPTFRRGLEVHAATLSA